MNTNRSVANGLFALSGVLGLLSLRVFFSHRAEREASATLGIAPGGGGVAVGVSARY